MLLRPVTYEFNQGSYENKQGLMVKASISSYLEGWEGIMWIQAYPE